MSFIPNRQLILDRICRVCLQYKTDLFFIFDEQFSVDGVKMPQLLTQCTNYSVNAFDSFPHHICGKCVDKAIFVYKFQQQAEKSHQTLTKMFASVGVNPNVKGRSSMESSTQTDNMSIYPCNMCGEKFSDSSDLIEHHLLRHPCKQDDCNVCGDRFTRLCQLRNDIMQIQPKDNSCPLRHTQSTHNQICESPTISLLSPKADERNNANFKNSLATIQTDFEEYETKVEKTAMFEYDAISIDDNYDNHGIENISTVESMDVTKVTSNENNSGPNAELSPRLLNEVPREASLISEFSYPAYMTSTTKSQSLSSSVISPVKKCANTMTTASMQIGTDLEQKHFSCHLCKRNFFTMEFLNKHLYEIHNQDLECSNDVAEAEELVEELEVEDFKPVLKEINTNTDSNIESLNEAEPPDNSLLTIHHNFEPPDVAMENSNELKRPKKEKLFKAETNSINCPRCNRTFARKSNLWQHLSAKKCERVGDKKFSCDICKRIFARRVNLVQHLSFKKCMAPNIEETFACKNCKRVFSRRLNLLQHLSSKICKKSSNGATFRCNSCNRIFSRRVNLNQHVASKKCKNTNKAESHQCRNCSTVFCREKNLRHHLASRVCETVSWACSTCGKVLSTKSHLKRHMKIHDRATPCKCQYCDKGFSNALELKIHERHHSKLKEIVCKICGKNCHQPKFLKIHMQTHLTIDRPFKCQKCLKTYTNVTNLNRHALESHGVINK